MATSDTETPGDRRRVRNVRKAYKAGTSKTALAREYNVSRRMINKWLAKKKTNGKANDNGHEEPGLLITNEELGRQHQEGATVEELATRHGVSEETIKKNLPVVQSRGRPKGSKGGSKTNEERKDAIRKILSANIMHLNDIVAAVDEGGFSEVKNLKNYVSYILSQHDEFVRVSKENGGGSGCWRVSEDSMPEPAEAIIPDGPRLRIEAIGRKDKEWETKRKIWRMCAEEGIKCPDEIRAFFQFRVPDKNGPRQILKAFPKHLTERERSERSVILLLDKIPENTVALRIEF